MSDEPKSPLWDAFKDVKTRLFEGVEVIEMSGGKLAVSIRLADGEDINEPFIPFDAEDRAVIVSSRFDNPEREWIVTEALRKAGYETISQEQRVQELLALGLSTSVALDYVNTVEGDYTQTQWSTIRGVDQSTVSENVSKARRKLDE